MEIELSSSLVQKIRNKENLKGDDYKMALSKWNEIRKSFGISPKTVDCCKGSQENLLKTLNNYYDSKLVEPEILLPYVDEETPRQKADRLGLKYHPNIGDAKLLIKIQEHEDSKQ
jgi:hypothetical protein